MLQQIKGWGVRWLNCPAWLKIVVALLAGIMVGLLLGHDASVFRPIGVIFIHAINLLVVPVVFTSIVCAVLSINDATTLRRSCFKALLVYVVCMAIAAVLGITLANLIHPGVGLHLLASHGQGKGHHLSFVDLLINMVPSNVLNAFSQGNVVQILVFALLFGYAIKLVGSPAKPVADFFQGLSQVVFKLAGIIMSFAPYGIFALIAWTFGSFGLSVLLPLAKFVGTVYLACLLQMLLVYAGILYFFVKLSPKAFFKNIRKALLVAYTTSSSAATLPVSIRCAEEKLKVKRHLARFLLPLGCNFNLNGLSIYLSVATIFAANIYGIQLTTMNYFIMIATIIITAMGAAGVPGSALIVMGAVMASVGLPLGAIGLIAGVDRLNDMAQTTTNVAGDLFSVLLVAASENQLEQDNDNGN